MVCSVEAGSAGVGLDREDGTTTVLLCGSAREVVSIGLISVEAPVCSGSTNSVDPTLGTSCGTVGSACSLCVDSVGASGEVVMVGLGDAVFSGP